LFNFTIIPKIKKLLEVKKELIINYTELPIDSEELTSIDKDLISKAIKATNNSYSPYSHFSVGAAVLLANGEIVTGSNQENAAYPSGLCAERVALFYANSMFPNSAVQTLAVTAKTANGIVKSPVPPCGACRQVMLETENRFNTKIKIILIGLETVQIFESSKILLPFNFEKEMLK